MAKSSPATPPSGGRYYRDANGKLSQTPPAAPKPRKATSKVTS